MAGNQEEMKDIQTNLTLSMVAREVFPAVAGIADNVKQEVPPKCDKCKEEKKNTVPRFLKKDLRDYPDKVVSTAGSFGAVLKVYSALIGTAVLKEPRNVEYVEDEVQEKRWDREVECIYSLNHHPNIVTLYGYVYDAFTDRRPRGVLMEYMHGGSLLEFVENYVVTNKYMLMPIVKNTWSKQIALGLNFIHSRDIMHRDLKPNNILLNQNRLVAKIADFGLSRTVDISGRFTNNIGNPLYTAPEVYSDTEYNKPADVWSYGMLLYFIHYLEHPFDEKFKKKSSYMRSRLLSGEENGTPSRPELQGKDIDVIIKLCWESKPKDRCSMTDVVNAFHSESGVQHFLSLAV